MEIPDPECLEILMAYLEKDKEIKKSLKTINFKLEEIPLNEKMVVSIGDAIISFPELNSLSIVARN